VAIEGDYRRMPGSRLPGVHGTLGVGGPSPPSVVAHRPVPSVPREGDMVFKTSMSASLAGFGLKLRPIHLSEREIATIDAFLRVGRHRLGCDWSVVLDGPCDVLMLGRPQHECALAEHADATAILPVQAGNDGQDAEALVRPLQYEAFVDALSALERTLLTSRPPTASPIPVATAASAETAPAHGAFSFGPQARFRLRRWPPAALLRAHRYNIRLASFMSGRHLGMEELARLSNVDKVLCDRFLVALRAAAILDVKLADTAVFPPLPAQGSAIPLSRHSPVEHRLLERIRVRLGLKGRQ